MSDKQQHIAILGAGESGVGAAILAKEKGFTVLVSDFGTIKKKFKNELIENEIEFEEGGHSYERIVSAEEVIKSPGIPNASEFIQCLKKEGVTPISDLEFAARYTDAKFICITGSNGKTTTTHLVHHVLTKGGIEAEIAGNVGVSFSRKVMDLSPEYFVIEMSSFQLEDVYEFKADISILLNITPDHLDRYENSMELYGKAKMRVTQNQTAQDAFIFNADDPQIRMQLDAISKLDVQQYGFSLTNNEDAAAYLDEESETITIKNKLTMSIHDLALKGKHNVQNSLAAGLAGKLVDLRKESIRESLSDFTNVEHRLEFVAKVNGIEFINDSKATNINATWFALESMTAPTVWVVGGVDKGNDYDELIELVREKVKAIVCLGKNNQKIIDAFTGVVDSIVETESPMDAVGYAYQLAVKDETVLLSPACASFDLFENYEDRGQQFKNAVRRL